MTTRLDKKGYYEFDANKPTAMVFKGEAQVQVADGKWKEIKGHHELVLVGRANESLTAAKTSSFDEDSAKDELYNWNRLRSQYVAEANNEMAGNYAGPIAGPGWYWDPYMFGYTYMGVGPFSSPFGWGFYPFGWGGWYPGFYGRGYYAGRYGYAHGYSGSRNGGNFGGFHGGGGHR